MIKVVVDHKMCRWSCWLYPIWWHLYQIIDTKLKLKMFWGRWLITLDHWLMNLPSTNSHMDFTTRLRVMIIIIIMILMILQLGFVVIIIIIMILYLTCCIVFTTLSIKFLSLSSCNHWNWSVVARLVYFKLTWKPWLRFSDVFIYKDYCS